MILVLGAPDPVAIRLMEVLTERGSQVAAVVDPAAQAEVPRTVKAYSGDAARIDFGLAGPEYRELLGDVTELVFAETDAGPYDPVGGAPRSDVENSRVVRTAAEAMEFVKAGGARGGVRFLSSLLVFAEASGQVTEEDFRVGQSFRDNYEESLAVAEKLISTLKFRCPLSIVRAAPIVGDEVTGRITSKALARLVREVESTDGEKSFVFSEQPVRFDTVDRVAQALLKTAPQEGGTVVHLVDKAPPTDSQFVEWLFSRAEKKVRRADPSPFFGQGPRPWSQVLKGYSGARALSGWGLRFDRRNARKQFPELLDRDDFGVLARLVPMQGERDA
jgi:nucleoside-diphosphate-sugar epimerase